MPRIQNIQTNFTAGEWSPKARARVDVARYRNSAQTMSGCYPLVQGGANRHPGLRYVAATKTHSKKSRLIPFVFSASQAYQLEFGDLYMRVYRDNGQVQVAGVPYEIVTPFLDTELPEVNYVQSSATAFITHPAHFPQKLTRTAHTSWKLQNHALKVEPHDEIGTIPNTILTLSATSGAGVTATATAAAFEAADVGRQIQTLDGLATIVGYTSTTVVTVNISQTFASVSNAALSWTITESPKTTCTPSAAGPEGAGITLTLAAAGWKNAPTTDVGRYVAINGGLVEITGFTSSTVVSGVVRAALFSATAAPSDSWSMESKVWNATDGYPRAVFLWQQRLIFAGTTRFPNRIWASRVALYDDFTTGALDSDALDFDLVSDQQNPIQHIRALRRALIGLTYGGEFSVRGGVEKSITPTNVQADEEGQYGIKNVRPVRVGNEIICVQRAGRKVRAIAYDAGVDGYESKDISVLAEHITETGIEEIVYAQEPDSQVWMRRADGVGVSLTLSREQEVVGFARRPTDGAIESLSVNPYNDIDQVWAIVNRTIGGATKRYVERMDASVNTDCCITGALLPIQIIALTWGSGIVIVTTASAHGLTAGSKVRISGTMPAGYLGDRTCIAGTAGTTIQYAVITESVGGFVEGTATPLASVWAGFDHLEGKEVDVLGDGAVFEEAIVSGGIITMSRAVATIEAGRNYESRLRPQNPDVQLVGATSQGVTVGVNEITVSLYKTIGGRVETYDDEGVLRGEEEFPSRRFGPAVLDIPLVPFTGEKSISTLGWGKRWTCDIVQDQPLPFCVSAVITKLTVND